MMDFMFPLTSLEHYSPASSPPITSSAQEQPTDSANSEPQIQEEPQTNSVDAEPQRENAGKPKVFGLLCSWKFWPICFSVLILCVLCAYATYMANAGYTNILQKQISDLQQHLKSIQRNYTLLQTETLQLKAKCDFQRAILSSKKLTFLWEFCNKPTMSCVRCRNGWVEHNSRCFLLSGDTKTWLNARKKCLNHGGDLAVVTSREDQAFLTNLTLQGKLQQTVNHSAWIGLNDIDHQGIYLWVNEEALSENLTFWSPQEPNNFRALWDTTGMGQDCIAILPRETSTPEDALQTWDDIICTGQRNYICETRPLEWRSKEDIFWGEGSCSSGRVKAPSGM